jgi:hypothetical protein
LPDVPKLPTTAPLLHRTLLALVVFFCFRAVVLEMRASQQYKRVSKWPITHAQISSSIVYTTSYSWTGKTNRFCPQLTYSYTVQKHDYVSSNRVFDFVCWPDAYDFVAQHKPGTMVTIAYDPSDPNVSVIPSAVKDPGYPWGDLLGGIALTAVLLFGTWKLESTQQD